MKHWHEASVGSYETIEPVYPRNQDQLDYQRVNPGSQAP